MFNDIYVVISKEVVFWLYRSSPNFGLKQWNLYTLASFINIYDIIRQRNDR